MRTALAIAALAAFSTAASTTYQTNCLTSFLLVTTSSSFPSTNSASLPNVNATSLFDPNHQTDFFLRLIAPGYGSLPRFNLSQGTLHTDAENVLDGFRIAEYNSTSVLATNELAFNPAPEGTGNISLKNGYLLAVGGDVEGWTVCQGNLQEDVIYWRGNGSTCVKRYMQAVNSAPY